MNERQGRYARVSPARLGLILALATIALGVWSATEVYADAPFATAYGGVDDEYAFAMQQTADGGYIVVGSTYSFGAGDRDVWVLKLDDGGSVAWQRAYGGVSEENAYAAQQTADGGYVVVGYVQSFGAGGADAWVLKLDAGGNVAWQKTYGGAYYDQARAVQQTADGGYVVAGSTMSFGIGGSGWLLKLDAEGNVAWQKTYGGITLEYAQAIRQTADGGYVVGGYTASFGIGDFDAWVLKLDAAGSVSWQKTYGGVQWDCVQDVQQMGDGSYVVAGWTYSFGAGESDAWVLKLNADGSIAWQKTYGSVDYDYIRAIQQTAGGGYAVAGWTSSFGAGGNDAWVLKLNADGSIAWQKTYGGADNEDAITIQQTGDGGYAVVGSTVSFGAGGGDAWLLKLDAGGGFCEGCALGQASTATAADSSATVMDSSATTADSTATVADSSATVTDSDASVEPICDCTPAQPDLSVTKTVTPAAEVAYHGVVTYTVVLGNSGLVSDTGVLLTDTLPAEVDFGHWAPGGQPAGAEVVADELTWSGTVTGGQALTFTFVVSHVGAYGDVVVNTAMFSGTQQAGEDSATFTVLGPEPDLFLTKAAMPLNEVAYHGVVTYTVVLGNSGPASDTGVLLTDTLPAEVDFSHWAAGGQPAGAEVVADELTWQGTVTAGQAITFTFVVSHVGSYGDVLVNTATFSGTRQAGQDSATFTVAERVMHTAYLPLVLKNHPAFPPFVITYGGISFDYPMTIQQTDDGGYVAAGLTESFGAGSYDFWVLKLDAEGSVCAECALGEDSTATPVDSDAMVIDSDAIVEDTDAILNLLCACPLSSFNCFE